MPEALDLKRYREHGLMPGVFRWLDEDLKRADEEVTALAIDADIRETTFDVPIDGPAPQWRSFAPTGIYSVGLTFSDEQTERRVFTTQELGMN